MRLSVSSVNIHRFPNPHLVLFTNLKYNNHNLLWKKPSVFSQLKMRLTVCSKGYKFLYASMSLCYYNIIKIDIF